MFSSLPGVPTISRVKNSTYCSLLNCINTLMHGDLDLYFYVGGFVIVISVDSHNLISSFIIKYLQSDMEKLNFVSFCSISSKSS